MKQKTILSAKNLFKSYASPVLCGVNLELMEKQSLAIVGRSGEGKSTLLHILGTLEKPCQGTVEICGKDSASFSLPALRREHIGFIFQSFHLLEEYSLMDNLLMPARIARKKTAEKSPSYERALFLLEYVGLIDRKEDLARNLSGGEKQRLAIARALCNDPDLILADEPSGNLDQAHSQAIHELLMKTAAELGKALIIVTHDLELASCCQRCLTLKNGQLLG